MIVAAIYLLWAYQQVFHGEPREADEKTRDLALLERLVVAPLIILIVFLGVYPKPVLDRINPSVNQLVAHVETSHGPLPAARWPSTRRGGDASDRAPPRRGSHARRLEHHHHAAHPASWPSCRPSS